MRIVFLMSVSLMTATGAFAADPSWDNGSSGSKSEWDKVLKDSGLTPVPPASAGRPVPMPAPGPSGSCPAEMAAVQGFCIDRWEDTTVDMGSGRPVSPYY